MSLRIPTVTRIAIGLTSTIVTVLLTAEFLGLIPDARKAILDGRRGLCEAVAVPCCLAAQRNDLAAMRSLLGELVSRNRDVCSAAIRRPTGTLAVEVGEHQAHWLPAKASPPRGTQIAVPIYDGRQPWGSVEIRFRPLSGGRLASLALHPALHLTLFVAAGAFLVQRFYLGRVLRFLNPTSVVPERVRATLDTLAEGVLILDEQQQIVLANNAFAGSLGRAPEELLGIKPSEMPWRAPESDAPPSSYPWSEAVEQGVARTGVLLQTAIRPDDVRTVSVSAMPIIGNRGDRRGVLATFDDVTQIEQKNVELAKMLHALQDSRDEIQRQNRELHLLATCDPLTSCLNRRSFFEKLEAVWKAARRYGQPLSLAMVDVDHFKSVNDRFGHSTGDRVLKEVGGALRAVARDSDLVCRYGGEEFCILLSQATLEQAAAAAERCRAAIAAIPFENLSVTASLGVAELCEEVNTPQELLDRADQALYAAKHGGRNQVVRWDCLPPPGAGTEAPAAASPTAAAAAPSPAPLAIPFHAVTVLTSALAYRDTLTAEHSRQVAELCVAAARGLMSARDCYVLEIAAMLHDIGKLAIPDAILLKPGKLTRDEWKIMHSHDRIGAEILEAAFSSPEVTQIVRLHHAWYAGNPENPDLPQGEELPVGARLLAIADAYQAMIADRLYRKARPREDAFRELRRCAGTQFDPTLVEHFVERVLASDQSRATDAAAVSKQAALNIGLQMERLAVALDQQDFPSLASMAAGLSAIATDGGATEIARLASTVQEAAAHEPDLVQIVQLTAELLDLCRNAQRCYLDVSGKVYSSPS